ncbi:MAG: hypothetical protein LBR06_03085 [Bacteroidales bacterium]|jgi:tetratricopeptide (TPR) repeat protein|nr:hypothetical protein [Bacteroidales bacterium]
MLRIKNIFALVLALCSVCIYATPQDPEAHARQLFEAGRFEEALAVFRDLVRMYPDDAGLNGYYGACLIETMQFGDEAIQALDKANTSDAAFFRGKYLHAHEDWKGAIANYTQFITAAKKKNPRRKMAEELIAQCRQQQNPFQQAVPPPPPAPVKPVEIPAKLRDTIARFQVDATVNYLKISQFKDIKGLNSFVEGWIAEQQLAADMRKLSALRSQYATLPAGEIATVNKQILELEQETIRLNEQAQQAYSAAIAAESAFWATADAATLQALQQQNASIEDSLQALQRTPAPLPEIEPEPDDELAVDTLTNTPQEPKPIYKILLGAYKKSPPTAIQTQYRKLAALRKIFTETGDDGIIRYTVGELNTFKDAEVLLEQVKQEGIKNASIIALLNNKIIPLEDAKQLTGK